MRLHGGISGQDAPPDIDLDILPPGAFITQRLMEVAQPLAVFFQGGEQHGLWRPRVRQPSRMRDPSGHSGYGSEH
jgi:hypothetical protein